MSPETRNPPGRAADFFTGQGPDPRILPPERAGVDMLSAALDLASRGFFVFPCYEIRADGLCACGGLPGCSPGKHPRTANGLKDATTDPDQIREWWTRWKWANIAIACRPSRLVVIDCDVKPSRGNGIIELEMIEERYGRLPYSLRVRTPSGGLHVYLRGTSTDYSPFNFCDVRGSGYVIAPPSTGYEWLDEEDSHLEDAPPRLLLLLQRPVTTLPEVSSSEALPPGSDAGPFFAQALQSLAAGSSRHNSWLHLCLQIRDSRLPASTLNQFIEPFLVACQRPSDRNVTGDELADVARWVFARGRRDPHPSVEKLLLPDLLERPVDGDGRLALIRRTARILIPILDRSKYGSLDLALVLLEVLNDARCRPPLPEAELATVVSAVLQLQLSRRTS